MNKMTSKLLVIIISVLLACTVVLRFFQLGKLPPGTNLDEINIGVEALSIAQTGRDSWGEWMPRTFRAFGEYKAPGLIYSIVGVLKFIPLTPLATRLPSAIAGLLSCLAIYLIIGKLLPKKTPLERSIYILIFSISPWIFGISRQFYEANVGLPFFLLALYFLLSDLKKKNILIAGILFGISGYFYMTFRYIAILTILAYGLLYLGNFRARIRVIAILLLITIVSGIGWSVDYLSQKSLRRLSQFNDYTTFGNGLIVNENREFCYLVSGKNPQLTKICYIFWNKPTVQLSRLATTYFSSVSPTNLFLEANNDFTIPKNFGMYIWVLLPFYLFGLLVLVQSWVNKNADNKLRLFSLWLAVAPIPQMLTTEVTIHRNVIFLALVFPVIVLGFNYCYSVIIHKHLTRTLFSLFALVLVGFYSGQYLLSYFTVFTHSDELKWNYDKQEIWNFIGKYDLTKYRVIDTKYLGPMDAAFYQLIAPLEVQQGLRATPNAGGWSHLVSAGNVTTGDVNIMSDLMCQKYKSKIDLNTIIITDPHPQFVEMANLSTLGYTGVHTLHQVFDLDKLYDQLLAKSPAYFQGCK